MPTEKQKRRATAMLKGAVLVAVMIATSACVYDPYPPEAPAVYAPAAGYYGGPYSYYEYPPYYGYGYGPGVGLNFNFGGDHYHGGYHHWH